MSTATNPPQTARPQSNPGRHHQRLSQLRDLEWQHRWFSLIALICCLVIGGAGLLALGDFFLELPAPLRLLGWLAIVAGVGGCLWLLRGWLSYGSADAACAAERAWPELGQRLRTSNDYTNQPDQVSAADPSLLSALEHETEQQMTSRHVEPLVRTWPLYALAGTFAVLVVAWLAGLLFVPEWRISTARLAMLPVNYTDVELEPLPDMVPQGENLQVRLHVDGRPLRAAVVRFRTAGDEPWSEARLQSTADAPRPGEELVGDLLAVIPGSEQDYEVQIQAGPIVRVHPVSVRIPLILEEWQATVIPPAYTGLPETEGPAAGRRVPEGSTLKVTARYNRAPGTCAVTMTAGSESEQLVPQLQQQTATLSFVVGSEPIDLSVAAQAEDGMSDESMLSIDVVPDQPPLLRFAAPDQTSEALPTAEVRFSLEAIDDYGLTSAGIRYRIDDGPEQTLWNLSPDEVSPALAETVTLPLEDLDLAYPQAITYYAFARDNRDPGRDEVTSELRFLDIRPFARAYEFRESNCSGNCQGECLTLEKLIKTQRELLDRTFTAARASSVSGDVSARLADEERELGEKTAALTEALEAKVGPMPELHQATESMASAVQELQKPDLAEGQRIEEQAVSHLIAARRNLRNILKQCNSQSQMCRNVDQQQMDKLRKPQREQPQQEQQLASLLEEINQLATQQQSFCESAQACSQASASKSRSGAPSAAKVAAADPQQQPQTADQQPSEQPQPTGSQSAAPEQQAADSPPSPEQQRAALVQTQQQAAEQARDIQQRLQPGQFGELAPRRMQQAAEAIEQSGQALGRGDQDQEAIDQARQAADQLERLAAHLGRRHGPGFDEKLAAARHQAERLVEDQRGLNQSLSSSQTATDSSPPDSAASGPQQSPQDQQRQLAGRGDELADLVRQLQADAAEQDWDVQRELQQQSPHEQTTAAASAMHRATDLLSSDQAASAHKEGRRAADLLSEFAQGLRRLEQARGPARLAKLQAAEQQAAALLKQARRADSPAEQALAGARSGQLIQTLQPLASGDRELTRATDWLDDLAGGNAIRQTEPPDITDRQGQFATPPQTLAEGLRKVNELLQQRIQEAILQGALQQADDAVPPGYLDMVEEYYRTLSEDVE